MTDRTVEFSLTSASLGEFTEDPSEPGLEYYLELEPQKGDEDIKDVDL